MITDKGRDHLASVDGPNPPLPRAPNRSATPRLIDEITAAGGALRVRLDGQRREEAKVDYERRVLLAEQRGDVPPGKRFVLTRAWPELLIELCNGPPGAPIEATPVPVPERVRKFHSVVKAFREQVERHEVSAEQLPRVCRILQGLVVEAERRGRIVDLSPSSTVARMNRPRWSAASDGHLRLTVSGYVIVVRIRGERIG